METTSRDTYQAVVEPPARRGRPPGEDTPESLIRKELLAHLRLYRKTREIVEARLDTGTADVDEISKYMDLLRKGIVEMAKPFVASAKPGEAARQEPEEDGETILRRMLQGATR